MPTSAVGDAVSAPQHPFPKAGAPRAGCHRAHGFSLLELLLVVAIIGIALAGVAFALPDNQQTALAREADRMTALLDAARARAQAGGIPVRFRTTADGFRFDGLPEGTLPARWQSDAVAAAEPTQMMLGPDPIIGPQQLRLLARGDRLPGRMLIVRTDGVRPFRVEAPAAAENQ